MSYTGWAQQYLFLHDLFLHDLFLHDLFLHDVYKQGAWESYTALYQPLTEPVRPLKK